MTEKWLIASPLVALIVVLVSMQLAVRMVGWARRRAYLTHEDVAAVSLSPAVDILSSAPSLQQKSLWGLISADHLRAIDAQDRYIAAVARAATCLFLGFCAFAIDATPLAHSHGIMELLAWIETISIFSLAAVIYFGQAANTNWIVSRIRTELLRQFSFFAAVFPDQLSAGQADITSKLEAESHSIDKKLEAAPTEARLASVVEDFWVARREAVAKAALTDGDLTSEALLMYLKKRSDRQLNWFANSRMRLERNAKRRRRWLLGLYLLVVLTTLAKFFLTFLVHHQAHPQMLDAGLFANAESWLNAILLLLTGLSATLAAYYLNQNSRSLIHRYAAQVRKIRNWFTVLESSISLKDIPKHALSPTEKDHARNFILSFEDLMIDELLDWIHITDQDSIEISA